MTLQLGSEVKYQLILKVGMLHIKIKGIKSETMLKSKYLKIPLHIPMTSRVRVEMPINETVQFN